MTDDPFDFRRMSQLERVESMKNMLVGRATGGAGNDLLYREVRRELIDEPTLRARAPTFVRTCRDVSEFWRFIQGEFASYHERQVYLRDQFEPLLSHLEGREHTPIAAAGGLGLSAMTEEAVHEAWRRMLERRATDPEGAITSARTLVETVCKHILDDLAEPYKDDADLLTLYQATAKKLNLAPAAHTEQVFKQILGGCASIVNGLAAVRNKHGDAHGKGQNALRPSARHADLAVNVGGAMAAFLVATWSHVRARAGVSA